MYNGIVVVNKGSGFTSFDVVAKMRGIFGQKKIGHTGTLDPDATGVLPVCLGNATKVCELLTGADKEYEAQMILGVTTDTQDISGNVLCRRPAEELRDEDVIRALDAFRGTISQIPPMYSALKVNGKKLCDLARAGKVIERQPREVTVHELEILSMNLPVLTFRVRCSKGTYVRTICHDLGETLGCGGTLTGLKRLRSGCFSLADSFSLDELQEKKEKGELEEVLLSVDRIFSDCPALQTFEETDKKLLNGAKLDAEDVRSLQQTVEPGRVRMYDSAGIFRAIYVREEKNEVYRPLKMFL